MVDMVLSEIITRLSKETRARDEQGMLLISELGACYKKKIFSTMGDLPVYPGQQVTQYD